MRPTRLTRQRRLTKPGKGGWAITRHGFVYTHPVTGNGVSAGWRLWRTLSLRREQERNGEKYAETFPVHDHPEAATRPFAYRSGEDWWVDADGVWTARRWDDLKLVAYAQGGTSEGARLALCRQMSRHPVYGWDYRRFATQETQND